MVKNRLILISIITASIIALDQITKYLLTGINYKILPFFQLLYVKNTGAAFGILQNSSLALFFLGIMIIGLVLFYLDKIPNTKYHNIILGIILGGAIGNLIDRIIFGYVRDFIFISKFPVFNIADSAISIGLIIWIIYELKNKKK